jgi:hypothetical protein
MVGSVVDYRRRTGGYVGVFDAGGDGLGDEHMSDEMSQAAWAQAWETYQRRKKENEERAAFCAGYREGQRYAEWDAQQEMRGEDAIDRSPSSGAAYSTPGYGTFAWAYQRMQDGRKVKRKDWRGCLTKKDTFFLSSEDLFATDWELYWGESEAPDSPCDSP